MAAPMSPDEGDDESVFEQELELLKQIYIHEMDIKKCNGHPCELSLVLHPATADRTDLQYVTLTLIFQITKEYPDVLPEIIIRNPRGMSEGEINSLHNKLKECAASKLGEAMLFELIELAKESLTANNLPSCECVICCHTFEDNEAFTKTQCYHYFHNNCLVRYLKYAKENEEEAVCPVCREMLEDFGNLSVGEGLSEVVPQFVVDPALRNWQIKMSALKTKQAQKGGIIDVVANSNKFLLDISSTPSVPVVSVPIEPAKDKGEDDKIGKEGSSSRKFKGYPENKSDSGKLGRTRRTHARDHQYRPHSGTDRNDRKVQSRSDRESRAGSVGKNRGRYNHRSDQFEENQRKTRSPGYATQNSERLASKPAPASSDKSDEGKIRQSKLSAEKHSENVVVKKADDVDSKINGGKVEDTGSNIIDKETARKDEVKSDKKKVEEEYQQGNGSLSARVQSEVTSEEQEEQKRMKQSVNCHEKKEGDRNNARRVRGYRGRGSSRRGRGGSQSNPSKPSSATISNKNYRHPGSKKQNNKEQMRDKSQTKDVLSNVEGQRSKENQERDKGYKAETTGHSLLSHCAERTDKCKYSESEFQDGDRTKMAPPGFHGNHKIKPPPGFEEFR
ncbi:E3 ubiquitin-protein ligase RNF25 [Holothuria leucospilota]|uniref:E3 ubiquitin-protein ligase RNF25 n=1 Tax=Holothuria leucospilota TaxID=206669 RepID=A0A9Q1HC79_HOLLE|nr:E3 ubiquitin-protein ligase RNF25 [Holothuria leucospilota]